MGSWFGTGKHNPCLPRRSAGGDTAGSVATVEVGPVSRGPADPPAAARHALTRAPLDPPALRVVTYNILADQYASTDHAQNVLFGYCPAQCAPKASSSLALSWGACAVLPPSRATLSGVKGRIRVLLFRAFLQALLTFCLKVLRGWGGDGRKVQTFRPISCNASFDLQTPKLLPWPNQVAGARVPAAAHRAGAAGLQCRCDLPSGGRRERIPCMLAAAHGGRRRAPPLLRTVFSLCCRV